MRRSGLAIVGVVVFVLACGGGGARQPAAPEVIHGMQEEVAAETFAVTVTKQSQRQSLIKKHVSHVAPDGNTLQMVELTVRNDHTDPVSLIGRFSLRDAQERTYAPTPECQVALGRKALSGLQQLNPGQTESGTVCFQVPDDASGLQFGFKGALLQQPAWIAL